MSTATAESKQVLLTTKDAVAALYLLRHNIGKAQQAVLVDLCRRSEEKQHFIDKVCSLALQIAMMPTTGETENIETEQKIVHLHYFTPSGDAYIVENDKGCEDDEDPGQQTQAFGYADLGCGEWGYISIQEWIENGAELDLYWTPKPVSEIEAIK